MVIAVLFKNKSNFIKMIKIEGKIYNYPKLRIFLLRKHLLLKFLNLKLLHRLAKKPFRYLELEIDFQKK